MDIYFDDNNFLSNSSNHSFLLDGYLWRSVEHYFQANKYIGNKPYLDEVLNAETPKEAFNIGRKYPLPDNWKEIKEKIMLKALLAKFKHNEDIRIELLKTNNSRLIKDNHKDNYWGIGHDNSGKNKLGQLLMLVRDVFCSTCVLESETSYINVAEEDIYQRYMLGNFLRTIPDNFFANLRHFQPQIGCFNNCTFCSQQAKPIVYSFSLCQLKNIIASLKKVAVEINQKYNRLKEEELFSVNGTFNEIFEMPIHGLIGYGRQSHRPGVIYCYYDNDISVYPYLEQYLHYCFEDLGVKTRISTIGYSRYNVELQKTHKKINDTCTDILGGMRLSFTPYTPGYISKANYLSRDEFEKDCANFLVTYKDVISSLGYGYRNFCIEIRHKPLVKKENILEKNIDDYHVIKCANYLLISEKRTPVLNIATIQRTQKHSVEFDQAALKYIMFISEELNTIDIDSFVREVLNNSITLLNNYIKRECNLYVIENKDGIYYAVDPSFCQDGRFIAKQFYPITSNRNKSGYIDSERYFLNILLDYKKSFGLTKYDIFESAEWNDVENVIKNLENFAERLCGFDSCAAEYILNETIPFITSYVSILRQANMNPSVFFDKDFTIDTGAICNMGRGLIEYKLITDSTNMPLTPQHEIIYGANGRMSFEENIWRLTLDNIDNKCYILAEEQNLGHSSIDMDGNFNKISNTHRYPLVDGPMVDIDKYQFKMPGTKKE
jgi:ribA/ribD-fused uncharacterized protein